MIRFALIAASVLGFALTAAVGNLLVPLLRALVPPEKENGPNRQEEDPPAPPEPRGLPTMGGLCFIIGTLAAVGAGWTVVCAVQPELLGGGLTGRLLLADGKRRRAAHPKAKKPRHVQPLTGPDRLFPHPAIQKLKQGEPVSDRELRRALAAFKEGITLGER